MEGAPFFNRDMSWLSFNYRVLQEARDPNVPLYERIRFLSIFSSNMDEFFRVRMPEIFTLGKLQKKGGHETDTSIPERFAETVQQMVGNQFKEYGQILTGHLLPELDKHNIHLYYGEEIKEEHKEFVKEYFFSRVLSFLQPVWMDYAETVFLENNALYLVVCMVHPRKPYNISYAVVNIPSAMLPRFLQLPATGGKHFIVFLDDVIRDNLHEIFPGYEIKNCYSVKITRDAELNLEDELTGDIAEKIEQSLSKRDLGLPTRFLYEAGMGVVMRNFVAHYFNVAPEEMIEGGRYHNLKDLSALPQPYANGFNHPSLPALPSSSFNKKLSVLENILQRDHLLHLPYQSYNPVLRFFNEAAIHPDVKEIYVTLYRVAANSHIGNALISAAKNGKKVTVFVELKARFDEAHNLQWSKKMKAAGVKIVNSIPNLKVHAKVALVKSQTGFQWNSYGMMATGNFNESTARFYTDQVFFTADKNITQELELLFTYLRSREKPRDYHFLLFNELLVCQFNLVDRFYEMTNREIHHAGAGRKAHIVIKLNNLQEKGMIEKLYEASNAGVKIDLIIRGICCLVPGVKGWSENIRITRLVDRYLEHSRIFYFENNGEDEVYLGSSDWMNRNIHRRIEVCFPVKEKNLKAQLKKILELQLADNTKAVELDHEIQNIPKPFQPGDRKINAQSEIYNYIKSL
jgi:polyphosphate kinase